MNKIDLARKALDKVQDRWFSMEAYFGGNGRCDGGWCDNTPEDFRREELLYLIKQNYNNDEIFKNMSTKVIDIETVFDDDAFDMAFPDGVHASFDGVLPNAIQEYSNAIKNCEMNSHEDVATLKNKLSRIRPGTFTFHIDVVDYYDNVVDWRNEDITLTKNEIMTLLYCEYGKIYPALFQEDSIVGDDYSWLEEKVGDVQVGVGYRILGLDEYLDAWATILHKIENGEIAENDLDDWLAYFDDIDNLDFSIEDWEDRL